MDRGTEITRFGIMCFIGIAGMIFLKDGLFNLSALVFGVSTFILILVLIIPNRVGGHLARRI